MANDHALKILYGVYRSTRSFSPRVLPIQLIQLFHVLGDGLLCGILLALERLSVKNVAFHNFVQCSCLSLFDFVKLIHETCVPALDLHIFEVLVEGALQLLMQFLVWVNLNFHFSLLFQIIL